MRITKLRLLAVAVLLLGVLPATTAAARARPLAARGQPSPASVDFGAVQPGSRTSSAVTLTNVGNRTMFIEAVGTTYQGFVVGPDTCRSTNLRPGASCRTTVTFTPSASDGGRFFSAELTYGTAGIVPDVDLTGGVVLGSGSPIAWVHPGSVDFGTVPAGEVVSRTVTLTNIGGPALYMGNNEMGEDPDSFTTDRGCQDAVLFPGDSCTATVWYAPRRGVDRGIQQGNLWFMPTDNTFVWAQVPLTGTAGG